MRKDVSEKLQAMYKKCTEADKAFFKPIFSWLWKRADESDALQDDIMQEHKTVERLKKYLYKQAKELTIKGQNCICVRNDVVYEWAEDYFHCDDKEEIGKEKAEKEKREKELAEQKKRLEKNAERGKKAAEKKKASEQAEESKAAERPEKKEEPESMDPEPQDEGFKQMDLMNFLKA